MVVGSLVLTSLITLSCGNLEGNDRDGCSYAVKAGAANTNFDKKAKEFENDIAKDTEDAVRESFGASTIEVMSAILLGARFSSGEVITYRHKKAYLEVGKQVTIIGVSWNL